MRKITSARSEPLHDVASTRQIERAAAAALPPHALMQRAGLALARLTQAVAPHARTIWIACGPGNNGGDGFEAAMHLHRWGRQVALTWTGPPPGRSFPPDAHASRQRAQEAGVPLLEQPPATFDACVDALLGLGGRLDGDRPAGLIEQWLELIHKSGAPCICADLPTGLEADSGRWAAALPGPDPAHAANRHTLALLTLKPGLFTASGRDLAGQVWFDDLGVATSCTAASATARLLGADEAAVSPRRYAAHASHKGSFGDVAVVGGESTPGGGGHMAGAALLAGRAALHAGAGRVWVSLLGTAGPTVDLVQPELMFRNPAELDLARTTIVCGCGGGQAVEAVLPRLLAEARHLVLDADALNAVARDRTLARQLADRNGRGCRTVLTPHPLEAARLADIDVTAVQADRLGAAQALADRLACTVVLKGSGSVIAAPGQWPRVNSSGNARLATAGTGDVLAGMVGAWMAGGLGAFEAACGAVFAHGAASDRWNDALDGPVLTASALATRCG